MAVKKSPTPNPFSVVVSIAHYVGRYATIARKAVEDSWKNGRDMHPHIEQLFRFFNVPATEQWPKYVAAVIAGLCGCVVLSFRLVLGLLRALAK